MMRPHPLTFYEAALDGAPVDAVGSAGVVTLAVARWSDEPDADRRPHARQVRGMPVLDVGCGPGRLVGALNARGVPALGIDVSRGPSSRLVTAARSRCGAPSSTGPGRGPLGHRAARGRNIGTGGDPGALLDRCRLLLGPRGLVLVETDETDDADDTSPVILRDADGRTSRPMPWARVGARTLGVLAARCGFAVLEQWRLGGRTVVALRAL